MEIVGYRLINVETSEELRSCGGTWGECPAIPNPVYLPNGNVVFAPEVNVSYSGFMLVPMEMEEPA